MLAMTYPALPQFCYDDCTSAIWKKTMSRTRKPAQFTADKIAKEIRAELRSTLRARRDLYAPIQRFEAITEANGHTRYYVLFDMNPRKQITGLRFGGIKELGLPDERIHDRVLEFANAVWHLKDRLHQYAKATGTRIDCDEHAKQCQPLLVCADLANKKKHGRNENRSGLDPSLDIVKFNMSGNGAVEVYLDGVMNDKEVIVEKNVPIPFAVNILVQGDGKTALGDAREIINLGFEHWLPLIERLGVLNAGDRESHALRNILFDKAREQRDGEMYTA